MVSHPMRHLLCVKAVTISNLYRLSEYLAGRSYLKIYQYIPILVKMRQNITAI
jgi:hypothetical protein